MDLAAVLGGDNSWILYLPKYLLFLTLLMFMEQNIVSCVFFCIFCYKSKQNGCCRHRQVFVLLFLRVRIIGPCSKIILFPVGNKKKWGSLLFLVLKYMYVPPKSTGDT